MENNAVSNNFGSTSVNSSAIIARFGIPSTKSTGSAPTLTDAATTTEMHIGDFGTYIESLTGLDQLILDKYNKSK